MGEKRGMKALEMWCRRVTDGYRGVKVDNMTTSWRDGLAFCALIHHFRPDLIDFENLNKDDVFRNNELAFRTAEQYLGIPALLDAEDMVEYEVPDRLSMLTYLSQFYQAFGGSQQGSPARSVAKRPSSSGERVVMSESPPTKIPARPALPIRREPCAKCGLPVFIAERLLVGGRTLYHRSCFRCARCQNPLSLANCYETEDGQYCCEACPDEVGSSDKPDANPKQQQQLLLDDQYSAEFESALEEESVITPYKPPAFLETTSRPSAARSSFMSRLVLADDDETSSDDSRIPSRTASSKDLSVHSRESSIRDISVTSRASSSKDLSVHLPATQDSKTFIPVHSNTRSASSEILAENKKTIDSADNINKLPSVSKSVSLDIVLATEPELISNDVPLETISIHNSSVSQPVTASDTNMKEDKKIDDEITKDNCDDSPNSNSSIVKMRLKMFEQSDSGSKMTMGDVADKAEKTSSNRRYVLNRKDTDEETDNKVNSKSTAERIDDLYGNEVHGIRITGDVVGELKSIGNVSSKVEEYNRNSLKSESEIKETEKYDHKEEEKVTKTEEDVKLTEKSKKSEPEIKETEKHDRKEEEKVTKTEEDVKLTEKSKISDDEVPVISTMHSTPSNEKLKDDVTSLVTSKDTKDVKEESEKEERESLPVKEEEEKYPEDLNPFGDDDEEEVQTTTTPSVVTANKPESTNPFGSSDDEEEEVIIKKEPVVVPVKSVTKPPRPPQPIGRMQTLPNQRHVVEAPKVNLNPFWSEGDEPSSEDENTKIDTSSTADKPPIPLPRTIKPATTPEPSPRPRNRHTGLGIAGQFGSATSLSSVTSSSGGTTMRRKKKPAPQPPSVKELFPASESVVSSGSSRASSPTTSGGHSPRATPRKRKAKPAPLPPTSTPVPGTPPWEQEKLEKDVANRNRQSLSATSNISSPTSPPSEETRPSSLPPVIIPNKSIHGQWKRKKGPAPPRPVPQRRQIKAISMHEVRRELDDIEVKQQGLERQGVTLEQTIRVKFEQTPNIDDASITPDVEDLVLQLFELVNEKNELFRRQAELMYLRRQQRLEEEHADLEYQVRCLMERPESIKTDSDKAREEELIQRLVEVVERRNEIVECLEMDRLREAEEDHSIHTQLGIFAAKNKAYEEKNNEKSKKSAVKSAKKEKKLKKLKEKAGIKKGSPVIDMDKDIDETESLPEQQVKEKKSKKKWFS